jgi:hypothetical protein
VEPNILLPNRRIETKTKSAHEGHEGGTKAEINTFQRVSSTALAESVPEAYI